MILSLPAEHYGADFAAKGFNYYSSGHYRVRNAAFCEMIKRLQPRVVFEFCGAEGDLAEMLLQTCPTIECYHHTDFCKEVVEYTEKRLRRQNTPHTVTLLDIDHDWKAVPWSKYDLVVSTALEHVNHDLEIIQSIPKGCHVALCLPAHKWEGHVRCFANWREIKERYPTLRILDACTMGYGHTDADYNRKYLFTAEKR